MASLFLLSALLTFSANPIPTTWVVDQGGSGDFLTIQEAINASAPGDSIVVHAGIYTEDLSIPTSVTITGAAGAGTLIYPATSNVGSGLGGQILTTTQSCIVEANNVTLRSLVFDGDNPFLGADIDARNGIIVNDLNGPWSNLTVDGCTVRNVWHRAINISNGSGHSVLGNTVENAQMVPLESAGIMFYAASGTILGNIVSHCSLGIVTHAGSSGEVASNDVRNTDLGVLANGNNLASSVHDNYLQDNVQGVQLIGLNADVTVHHNTILGSKWAISFYGSTFQGLIEDNLLFGDPFQVDTGVYASTDLFPWGVNDISGHLARNEFHNFTNAILLEETSASKSRVLNLVVGGDAASSNSFFGNAPWNLRLANCDDNTVASWNSWGAATPAGIGLKVRDQLDDPALGLVDISNPIMDRVLVDANGGGDYLSIQAGVDAVNVGGLVSVMPGNYVGSVVINKSLVLEGSGMNADSAVGTNIFGDNASAGVGNDVVTVLASGVEIRNLRIDAWSSVFNARFGAGLILDHTSACMVSHVRVEHGTYGIYSYFSDAITVESSEVFDCGVDFTLGAGIHFRGSTGTIGGPARGNLAENCAGTGIAMTTGASGTMEENLAKNCGLGFLSNGAAAYTLLLRNGATACEQGFQGIGNNAPVDFVDNTAKGGTGSVGFSLYGIGGQPYLLRGNTADGSGTGASGFYVNPNTQWGSSDIHAVLRDNSFLNYNYGVYLDETGGPSFLLDLDFNGNAGEQNRIANHNYYSVFLANCNDFISMPQNFWGTTDLAVIETLIFHRNDDLSLGLVDYGLPLTATPDLRVDPIYLSAGAKVQFLITGGAGDSYRIFGGDTPGSWITPIGTLGLDQSRSRLILQGVIPPSGVFMTRLETGNTGPGIFLSQGGVGGSVSALTGLETFELN